MTTPPVHQDMARNIIRLRAEAADARARADDLQSRTTAAEQQAQQLTEQMTKRNSDRDDQLTQLNETARDLKKHPDLLAANDAVKTVKQDIGLTDANRRIKERKRELAAEAANHPDIAELQQQADALQQQTAASLTEAERLERQAEAETARLIDDIAG